MKPATLELNNTNPKCERFFLSGGDVNMKISIDKSENVNSISVLLSDGQNRIDELNTTINHISNFSFNLPMIKSGVEIEAKSNGDKPFNASLRLEYNISAT